MFFRVCTSFDLLRMFYGCDLDVTIRLSERAREKTRGNNDDLSYVTSKRKEEIKSGTSGCGSFVAPNFQPVTSIDRLQLTRLFIGFLLVF